MAEARLAIGVWKHGYQRYTGSDRFGLLTFDSTGRTHHFGRLASPSWENKDAGLLVHEGFGLSKPATYTPLTVRRRKVLFHLAVGWFFSLNVANQSPSPGDWVHLCLEDGGDYVTVVVLLDWRPERIWRLADIGKYVRVPVEKRIVGEHVRDPIYEAYTRVYEYAVGGWNVPHQGKDHEWAKDYLTTILASASKGM